MGDVATTEEEQVAPTLRPPGPPAAPPNEPMILLVANEHQGRLAQRFGLSKFGRGKFVVEVCISPEARLRTLGRDNAMIYHRHI